MIFQGKTLKPKTFRYQKNLYEVNTSYVIHACSARTFFRLLSFDYFFFNTERYLIFFRSY